MPADWSEVTLAEVSDDITVGHVGPMADEYVPTGVPFLRSLNVEPFVINPASLLFVNADFHRRLVKSALRPGDVLIVRTGKPGACAVVPEWLPEANCSDVVIVRPGPTVRAAYISYVVNSIAAHHISAHVVGAVQQHFNVGSARQIRFQLPPLAEQDRVIAVLGALGNKVDLNRRMNETLDAMARTLFNDWFVDFGPIRAIMEGRAPYLEAEIWSLFPERLDEKERPAGWSVATLAQFADLNPESWSRSTYPSSVRYVDLSGTKWGRIHTIETHSRPDAPSRAQRVLRDGDTIVGTVRPGNGSFAMVGDDGLTGSTGFAVLRPKKKSFREFVYLAATASGNIDRLSHLADGAAYPAVRPEVVLGTEAVTVPDAVVKAFSRATNAMLDQMLQNTKEQETLAAMRDLLLSKLMSSQDLLRDAERAVEAVL